MTQKDYIAMAAALATAHDVTLTNTAWLSRRQARDIHIMYTILVANLFAWDNPRFKRDTFYRACGLPELADN